MVEIWSMMEAALNYQARGWSVIPLKPRDKRPLMSWKEYQNRMATEDELFEWFGEGQNNIGIVAGRISNLTIVDCDSAEAIQFFEQKTLEEGGTLETYRVITPKGKHYYFAYQEGSSNFQAKKEWPGIDLRSEGGYVAAPPSIHPSGQPYLFVDPEASCVGAPSWLFEEIKSPLTAPPVDGQAGEDVFAPCGVGGRNMALTRLAGSLCVELPFSKVLSICQMWNRGNPVPLPEAELVRTVQSVASLEAKKRLEEATPVLPIIKEFETLEPEILTLRQTGIPRGVSTGFSSLDENYRIPLGQLTVMTGMPGSGKSTFLNHVAINLMELNDWKFVIFSGENMPYHHFAARLVATYLGKPFYQGPSVRLTEEEVKSGLRFLSAHCRYVDQGDEVLTIKQVLAALLDLRARWSFDGLILDPWNEFNHASDGRQTETNVYGEELSLIRTFARRYNIHAWVVAHPRQLQKNKEGEYAVPTAYDISGSANFRNRADFCVTVHRNVAESKDTEIHIQKVRHSENGMLGMVELGFTPSTNRYYVI